MIAKDKVLTAINSILNTEWYGLPLNEKKFFKDLSKTLTLYKFKLPKQYETLEEYVYSKALRKEIKAIVLSIFPDKLRFLIYLSKIYSFRSNYSTFLNTVSGSDFFKGLNPIYKYIFELGECDYDLIIMFNEKWHNYTEARVNGESNIILNDIPYVNPAYREVLDLIIEKYLEQGKWSISSVIEKVVSEECSKDFIFESLINGLGYLTHYINPEIAFKKAFLSNDNSAELYDKLYSMSLFERDNKALVQLTCSLEQLLQYHLEEDNNKYLTMVDRVINSHIINVISREYRKIKERYKMEG